jgi:hypothetical protein
MSKIDITFDSPNITFIVTDQSNIGNAWGWFEVTKENPDASGNFAYYSDGYLNGSGRVALKLVDGKYRVKFNPGKGSGIAKEVEFKVTTTGGNTAITETANVTFANAVGTVVLGLGNLTGVVRGTGTPGVRLANIQVTATSSGVTPITLVAITDANGNYYFQLDNTFAWTIKALDPISGIAITSDLIAAGQLPTTKDLKFS